MARLRCGTEAAFQRHLDLNDAACSACVDAHEVALANRRERYRRQPGRPVNAIQYRACLAGRDPAEVLCGADRDLLWRTLVGWGWTDRRVAEHTRMSTYTTVRIRERLGLSAVQVTRRAA
jgi:hypothetical protein